jgi:hypothetical protein
MLSQVRPFLSLWRRRSGLASLPLLVATLSVPNLNAEQNLLKNPGFEEGPDGGAPTGWVEWTASGGGGAASTKEAHGGSRSLSLPAHAGMAQEVVSAKAGAYLARCWVKSEADQPVTLFVADRDRPWVSYTYAEIKVPQGRWVPIETFCAVDQDATLTFAVGGVTEESRKYHGTGGDLKAPVLIDDCELVRYQATSAGPVAIWDSGKALTGSLDWTARSSWIPVTDATHSFAGTPIFQDRQLVGALQKADGTLSIYALNGQALKSRAAITPSPAFKGARGAWVTVGGKMGLRVSSAEEDRSYTAWLSDKGVIDVEPSHATKFMVNDCPLRYALLPSFVGTDICYAPEKMTGLDDVAIPSTRWLVGLVDGQDSILVAVWKKDTQSASLGLTGTGNRRLIDRVAIGTEDAGFSLTFVEHPNLWRKQALNEDWLGEYTSMSWGEPFPARWMGQFFVSPGNKASFREPFMDYSFPLARTKTRMWGVWFEDWNHYPFYFEGPHAVLHFEKSFVPQGEALFYFLEPAAADLYSPCEIVEQVLGTEEAAKVFDWDANGLRKLRYSTPNEFQYDRPVCATTTHLSKIKGDEKATVGLNLATHLYEFIREIRGRVDQYNAFFDALRSYLESEKAAHPDSAAYVSQLQALVSEAKARSKEIYATPLDTVLAKTEGMKKLLLEGKGDGFNCGNLDVRGTAGAQDDLCRRYNRLTLRLMQTAALDCGNSPENAAIAKHVWDESRLVLRRPSRWEPRRTLYFFEP